MAVKKLRSGSNFGEGNVDLNFKKSSIFLEAIILSPFIGKSISF